MSDIIERAEAVLQHGNAPISHTLVHDLVTAIKDRDETLETVRAALKAARAETERLRALADKWDNAIELGSGSPSIVAKAFAAEMRACFDD